MNYGSRRPLHISHPDIIEKSEPFNPSYRENNTFGVYYPEASSEARPGMALHSRIRRYPNGQLDTQYVGRQIVDAINKVERGDTIDRIEGSLLTVVFPVEFEMVEPQQAAIDTKLSESEKKELRRWVVAQIKEALNHNAGRGGGSVAGRSRTLL